MLHQTDEVGWACGENRRRAPTKEGIYAEEEEGDEERKTALAMARLHQERQQQGRGERIGQADLSPR